MLQKSFQPPVSLTIRTSLVAGAIAVLALAAPTAARAGSVADGVYTDAQAKKGEAQYNQNCAVCHMPDMGGKEPAPELAGDKFLAKWNGHNLDELYTKIKTTMPLSKPGSLTQDQYLSLVALLLQSNGFPSGGADLTADQTRLKDIKITQ